MPIHGGIAVLILFTLLLEAPVTPQAAGDSPRGDEIVVTGSWKPMSLDAKELSRAVKAHGKLRGAYAPQSQLFFQVLRGPGGRSLDGLTLTFRSKKGSVPVLLDANRRFTLPEPPGKGWKLVGNRRSGSFGVMPLVMSPGTADDDRLLGDLRLECQVLWEMGKPDLSIFMRATASVLGGFCKGSVLPFFVWSDRLIGSASVSSRGLARSIYITEDRHAYRPPLHDKTLSHTSRVRVRYE